MYVFACMCTQDEDERALALALLGSQGEKKTRADRRAERKGRKEAVRKAALVRWLADSII